MIEESKSDNQPVDKKLYSRQIGAFGMETM